MSKIRTLRPGDPEFTVVDGIIIAQRAGVEILSECPREKVKTEIKIDGVWTEVNVSQLSHGQE